MVVGQFWPVVGGAENQARRLAAELIRQGVPVEVWTLRLESSWPRRVVVDGVPVRRLGVPLPLPGFRLRIVERYLFMVALFVALIRARRQYDLIHVHQVLYPAFVAAVAGRIAGRPTLARLSSTGATSDLVLSARGGLGIQRALTRRWLTRIIAVNAQAEEECRRRGYEVSRIVRIPNGISIPALPESSRSAGPVCVLWLGRFRAEKRVDLLLDAWRSAGAPGMLTIAGDGPQRKRMEALAAAGGPSVELVGHVDDPALLLRQAAVFVLPSDAEGMSNALLEAMAWGLACVATWVGGNIDALGPEQPEPPPPGVYARGSAGLLVRTGDVDGLAAALRALCESADLRRELGREARRRCCERFSLESVASRYQELYRGMIGASAGVS